MKVCKLSVCKELTLYQSVHENVSESPLHPLFLHKTIQLSPFDLVNHPLSAILQTGDIYRIFHELQHSLATFATSILWCYNFNGMIKWYEISCGVLYIVTIMSVLLQLSSWWWAFKGRKTSNILYENKIITCAFGCFTGCIICRRLVGVLCILQILLQCDWHMLIRL